MGDKWNSIPEGSIFKAKGISYRKVDSLSYEKPDEPGIETYVTRDFEETIGVDPKAPKKGKPGAPKFIVDPQSRMMRLNPEYLSADEALAEMWGSAMFDCGPDDYTYMVTEGVAAVKAMYELSKLCGFEGGTEFPLNSRIYDLVVTTLTEAYTRDTAPERGDQPEVEQKEAPPIKTLQESAPIKRVPVMTIEKLAPSVVQMEEIHKASPIKKLGKKLKAKVKAKKTAAKKSAKKTTKKGRK